MSHPLTPIFNQAQQGRSLQKNSLTSLFKSLTSGSSGASQFLECVDVILSGKPPAAALENALEFVSKAVFIKDAVLMEPCLKLLMDRMECKDKGVRARAVELVARVLACAPPGAALPEGCFEALTPKLLARTGDKFPGVRAAAVRSLERLQECEPAATAAVLTALTQDTAAEVRCAAARSLWVGTGGEALTPLIQRATRDTSSAVRAAALTQLRHAAPWAAFSPPQRRALAGWVGKAPTPIERSAGTLLMATWLWGCSWDVLTLIEGLGVCEAFGEEGVEGVEGGVVPATASQPHPPTLATQAEAAVEGGLFALFAFAEGGRPSGGEALAVQLQSAGGGGGGGDSTPTTTTTTTTSPTPMALWEGVKATTTTSPTPMALWEGVKAALATTSPDPNEISPEAALYMWVRSSWLAHHSKASSEDVRGAAVEALNPDAPTLYGVLGAVGAALGCTPLGMGGGGGGGWGATEEGEGEELDMNDQALRDLVSTAGVPSPLALGCIPSLPTTTDPAALATLHSLLHTAAFVDTPEGPARNSAVGCILTMLPHPSTPSWAVGLLVERLAGCLGCRVLEGGQGVSPASPSSLPSSTSAEAYTLLVTLLIALVGSLREGVDVALKRGGEDAAHPSAPSSSSSSSSDDPCEALRQELEAAQDELMDAQGRGAPGDIAAARRNVAELTGRLGEAERVAAAGVGKQQPAATASTMMLEEGHALLPPGDLAGALWLRALTITNCLLGGPKGLVGGGYLPKALLPALLASPNPSKALLRPIPSELREAALGAGGEGGGRLLTSLIVPSMAHPFPPIQREAGRAATLLAMAQGGGEGVNAVLGAFGIGASLLQQATEGGVAPSIKASAIECLGDLVAVVGMGGGGGG